LFIIVWKEGDDVGNGQEYGDVENGEKDGVVVRGKNKNNGRVCDQWWTRGNSWCGVSKVM